MQTPAIALGKNNTRATGPESPRQAAANIGHSNAAWAWEHKSAIAPAT
jgi:hypothetical protein